MGGMILDDFNHFLFFFFKVSTSFIMNLNIAMCISIFKYLLFYVQKTELKLTL